MSRLFMLIGILLLFSSGLTAQESELTVGHNVDGNSSTLGEFKITDPNDNDNDVVSWTTPGTTQPIPNGDYDLHTMG